MGVHKWYGLKYKEYPIEYSMIFEKETSTQPFEEEVGVTGFGLAQVKPEGDGVAYDEAAQGFITRYTHITYALGFIITKETYSDGIAVTVSLRRAGALAFSMRQTKEVVGANVLNRAFTPGYTYGDGSRLCVTTHPNVSGGTWSNAMNPAADMSEAALEQACLDIADFKNDRGMTIAIRPRKLILPPELEFDTARILKSIQQSGTANNDINALRILGKFPEGAAINHYLTNADDWFIKTDCPEGMKYFERWADSFGLDNDFDTSNAKFKSEFRCSFGCTDPRSIYGSAGA